MSNYGLKYYATFESEITKFDFQIKVYERDYTGPASLRRLGGAPVLRKDENGEICGTSLEFLLETAFDGDLRELYTPDNKKFKVELWRYSFLPAQETLDWSGFIVTETYKESMIPVADIQITATDGLGLLKNEPYTLTGKHPLLEIVKYCVDKTGLELGYAVSSTLSLSASNSGDYFASGIINADIFGNDVKCYDVLTDLLKTLGLYITQNKNRWAIRGYFLASFTCYTSALIKENVDYESDTNKIGNVKNGHFFPVGNLEMEITPAKKDVTVTKEYKTYPSYFKNFNFSTNDGWDVGKYTIFDNIPCWVHKYGGVNRPTGGPTQSIEISACNRAFYLEVKYAVVTKKRDSDHFVEVVLMNKSGRVPSNALVLTNNGWELQNGEQNKKLILKVDKLTYPDSVVEWNTFKIYASYLPGSELSISLYGPICTGLDETDINIAAVYWAEVRAMNEIPAESEKTLLLNPLASQEAKEIDLKFGDAYDDITSPIGENRDRIDATSISINGQTVNKWQLSPDWTEDSFHNCMLQYWANVYNDARRSLSGTLLCSLEGKSNGFEGTFEYLYDNKKYRLKSGSYNLITDEMDGTWVETFQPVKIEGISTLNAVRSANTQNTEYRAAGATEYRTYQAGTDEMTPKMIRQLENATPEELAGEVMIEVDSPLSAKSKKTPASGLLGKWFYEKDGALFCRLDFVGEGGIACHGIGDMGGVTPGASALSELTDVQLTNLQTGNILQYDGTKWVNKVANFTGTWDSITGKPDFDSKYLKLTGGDITGDVIFHDPGILKFLNHPTLPNATGSLWVSHNGGHVLAGIGCYTIGDKVHKLFMGWGTTPYDNGLIVSPTEFLYIGNTIWHSGNSNSLGKNWSCANLYASEWIRSYGNVGWYSETYGGGIYMTDNIYVRIYGNKKLNINGGDVPNSIDMTGGITIRGLNERSISPHIQLQNDNTGLIWCIKHGWKGSSDNYLVIYNNYFTDGSNPVVGIHNELIQLRRNTKVTGNIEATGEITCTQPSDRRLKENLMGLDGLKFLRSIQAYEFDWNDKARELAEDNRTHGYGYIAQEVQKIFPDFVRNTRESEYLGIQYDKFIPIHGAAIIQLDKVQTEHEKRISELEKENRELREKSKSM